MKLAGFVVSLTFFFAFHSGHSQTLCESGFAGIYPCDKVDLMAHIPISTFGASVETNDIWGWTDAMDGKEYVLLGLTNGTGFVDISDPVNPIYLGHLPTQTNNSLWRDIKVYNDYAFIVSEAGGHGMQVFDLTKLRNVISPPATFTVDAVNSSFGGAHNIAINEQSAKAYVVGSSAASGGLHIIDISNPLAPTVTGDYALDGYTHDAQIVNYIGPDTDYAGAEIAFNSNENSLTIANVTDPTDAQTISINTYTGSQYAHQGWLTPDHQYFLLGDELDELNGTVTNTTTYIWDVTDLDAPVMIGTYTGATAAIDHNLYIEGNLVFQSNYRQGLRILDAVNVAAGTLSEVAYFDVYPSSDGTAFNGTWSNYPFFSSGIVAVAHIEEGLFLLRPQFVDLSPVTQAPCELDDVIYDVTLETGFAGTINLTALNLPVGVSASFSSNGVSAPATVQVTLSGLENAGGIFTFDVSATGDHFTYVASAEVNPQPAITYFQDDDNDGYGNPAVSQASCNAIAGYVLNDADCDDTRNDVYPDAPGTGEGIDNNCNSVIDPDEQVPCVADFNGDGLRNVADLLEVLADFGCLSGCVADLNGDDQTNSSDILIFLGLFGIDCP